MVVEDINRKRLSAVGEKFDLTETTGIVDNVAEAVRNAAVYNTRHLSLSPDAIWIGDDDQAAVGDWGLTDVVSTESETSTITPFTAPEQIHPNTSNSPGDETDIYRLGAVSYWLLTGHKPFFDEPDLQTAIMNDDPTPPSELTSSVPSDLDTPILRTLKTDSVHRYN